MSRDVNTMKGTVESYAPIIGHPLGEGTQGRGPRANTTFYGDLDLQGFERSFYPARGGNEGGLVPVSLVPQGKQGIL